MVREVDGIARRARVDLFCPAESAIRGAMLAVESMPADVRLTDAVILLGQAKDKVAEFVDELPELPSRRPMQWGRTPAGFPVYPPYANVTQTEAGDFRVTVRESASHDGRCGVAVAMTLSRADFMDWLSEMAAALIR